MTTDRGGLVAAVEPAPGSRGSQVSGVTGGELATARKEHVFEALPQLFAMEVKGEPVDKEPQGRIGPRRTALPIRTPHREDPAAPDRSWRSERRRCRRPTSPGGPSRRARHGPKLRTCAGAGHALPSRALIQEGQALPRPEQRLRGGRASGRACRWRFAPRSGGGTLSV